MRRKEINHLLVQRGERECKSRADLETLKLDKYSPPDRREDIFEKRVRTALGDQ